MDKISNERLLEIPTRNNKKWTYKETRFIDEYCIIGVATEAYRRAFPDADEVTVKSNASRLLNRPDIRAEIDRRSAELTKNSIMSAQEVLEMYTAIAKGEVLDQFGLEASLKDRLSALKELSRIQIDMASRNQQQDNTLTVKLVK